jgi:hypothetical protein
MTVPLRWKKSSRSQNTTNCVELAYAGAIRDSKSPAGPALRVKLGALLAAVKADRLDG